jgi:hypothetical protein
VIAARIIFVRPTNRSPTRSDDSEIGSVARSTFVSVSELNKIITAIDRKKPVTKTQKAPPVQAISELPATAIPGHRHADELVGDQLAEDRTSRGSPDRRRRTGQDDRRIGQVNGASPVGEGREAQGAESHQRLGDQQDRLAIITVGRVATR